MVFTDLSSYVRTLDEHQTVVYNELTDVSEERMASIFRVEDKKMLYEVCCSSNNRGLYATVHSLSPLLLFHHIVQCS
jgi:hypothetical protein